MPLRLARCARTPPRRGARRPGRSPRPGPAGTTRSRSRTPRRPGGPAACRHSSSPPFGRAEQRRDPRRGRRHARADQLARPRGTRPGPARPARAAPSPPRPARGGRGRSCPCPAGSRSSRPAAAPAAPAPPSAGRSRTRRRAGSRRAAATPAGTRRSRSAAAAPRSPARTSAACTHRPCDASHRAGSPSWGLVHPRR